MHALRVRIPRSAGASLIAIAWLIMTHRALAQSGAPGPTDEDIERAKTYFEAGRQAYEAGRYGISSTAFEEAQRLSPRPQVLFSLAQAHRQQYLIDRDPARLKRAVELFKQYVREVPQGGRRDHAAQHLADLEPQLRRVEEEQRLAGRGPLDTFKVTSESKTQIMITSRTPNATASVGGDEPSELPLIRDVTPGKHPIVVDAEGFIREEIQGVAVDGRLVVVDVNLKEKPAMIKLSAPDGAEVALDGRLVGSAPLTAALEVPAGRHFVAVTERGRYGYARELTLRRGEALSLEAELETTTQRTVSYYFLGTAVVLLGAGGVSGGIALAAENRAKGIDRQRTEREGLTSDDLDEYQSSIERRDDFAPASYVLLGAGLTMGVTGVLLFLVDSPRVAEQPIVIGPAAARVTPLIAPGLVGAAWVGAF